MQQYSEKDYLHNIRKEREVLYDYVSRSSFSNVQSDVDNSEYKHNVLTGLHEINELNSHFFSSRNIDVLQNMIKKYVYDLSGNHFLIDRQSDSELVIIMRSIYLQNAQNLDHHIEEQIEYLNFLVLKYAGPIVLSGVKQYYGYLSNINKLPIPLEQPKNMSSAGTRTLEGSANRLID